VALQTSGQISLNDIHVEAGGASVSGTACNINEADIRGLISASSGAAMDFADWYGASASQNFTTIKAGWSFFTYTGGRGSTQYAFDAGFNASGSAPSGSISYTDPIVVGSTTLGTLARASVDNSGSIRHTLTIYITGTNSNSGWTNVTCSRISNSASTTFSRTTDFTYVYANGNRQYIGTALLDSTGDLTAGSGSGFHCKFWGDDTPTYNSTGTDSTFTGKIEFS
jgi:hypothetical protein